MATYTIEVLNNSGFPKSYVIFSALPEVTKSGEGFDVFTNAWVTFNSIGNNGFDMVTYDDSIDAYWGTIPEELEPGVIVGSGGFMPVDTTIEDGVSFKGSTPAGFNSLTPRVATSGSFQIKAESDFDASNRYVFGMAKPTNSPIPSPVATFTAEPSEIFEVIPVVKFFVSNGSFTQGEIIDVKSFATNPAKIDFTGKAQTKAIVIQDSKGLFTVKYV
ncbi:MAG: hypothetical protein F6K09_24145 [Merismopedia sp. SIO2A8]|nr:hypothetical protein [Symploca sp. SIO2B6]NET51685.1 hypothetical protein [Merismopedia sp. SIO2A8]